MIERLLKQCNAGQTGRLYSSQNLNPAQSVSFSKLSKIFEILISNSRIVGKHGKDCLLTIEKIFLKSDFKMHITQSFNVKRANVGEMIVVSTSRN